MSASLWDPSIPAGATASTVPFTPSATIAATTVQAAIEEADTENRALLTAFIARLASAASGDGDALVAVLRTLTAALTTTQHAVNEARDVLVGVDYATPATAVTNGGKRKIVLPNGTYSAASLSLSAQQHFQGQGYTSDPATLPGATINKSANGTQLTLSGDDTAISNVHLDGITASYTGNGIQLTGSRAFLDCVSVTGQRSDGIVIGSASSNTNLWAARLPISMYNGGRGVYIHHTGGLVTGDYPDGTPDANAGVMVGGDIRRNTGIGIEIDNAIDNLFLGTAVQNNTGKGIVLRADNARGHMFVKPYVEANNGGAGAAGDEIDIELGAVQNAILGMRFQVSGGGTAGLKDVNPPGKNWIEHYEPGVGEWIRRGKFSVWNPQQDASSTSVDISAYLSTNLNNVFNLKGTIDGSSGGKLTIQTKRDGNTPLDRLSIDSAGNIFHHGGTLYMGSTTSSPLLLSGAGTPEGVVTGVIGSLFLRTDGGATTTLYVKTSGTGNTGWTAK